MSARKKVPCAAGAQGEAPHAAGEKLSRSLLRRIKGWQAS